MSTVLRFPVRLRRRRRGPVAMPADSRAAIVLPFPGQWQRFENPAVQEFARRLAPLSSRDAELLAYVARDVERTDRDGRGHYAEYLRTLAASDLSCAALRDWLQIVGGAAAVRH